MGRYDKQVILDFDEHERLLQIEKDYEKLVKSIPEVRMEVYGFMGDCESVVICKNKKEIGSYFDRYAWANVEEKEAVCRQRDKLERILKENIKEKTLKAICEKEDIQIK
jgi:hypothetical protein